jgi:iron complex transport system permease protein
LLVGFAVTTVLVLAGAIIGSADVAASDAIRVIVSHLFGLESDVPAGSDAIVWNIRLPRVLLAVLAGALLGTAGTVLQGSLRNPLADSQLVGLSAVASIGALIGYGVGYASFGVPAAVAGGAVSGLAGAWLVWFLAERTGGEPTRFILVGIGAGLGIGSVVAAASIAIHDPRIPDVTFWFFGGLGAATWSTVGVVLVVTVVCLAGLTPFTRQLDVLSLGREPARHVGVSVTSVLAVVLGFVGLGVGASVGAIGVVGFVGLVGGRVAVSLVGPHHRVALPAAAFTGAAFVAAADLIGRVGGRGFEVPVGLITTVIGGGYLIWLIATRRVAI